MAAARKVGSLCQFFSSKSILYADISTIRVYRMEQSKTSILERPKKELESETEPDDGNALLIPDGGWGWVVCFAGFMINFTIGGVNTSNGILLLGLSELYDVSISKTAMVGSIFGGIRLCVGPFVLLLMMFNASHRQVIICGGILSAVSTVASFFVEKIEVLYVTYGILSGGFAGMSYFAGNTIVGSYFKKKRTLAVGIAQSGSGIGAFVLNYLIERSIYFYGTRVTFLIIGELLLNFVVYGALCRPLKTVNMKNKKQKETQLKYTEILKPEMNLGFEDIEKTTENNNNNNNNTNINNSDASEKTKLSGNSPTANTFSNKCSELWKIIFDADVLKNRSMQMLLATYILATTNNAVVIYVPAKVTSVGLTREQGAWIMSMYGAVFAFSDIFVGILADVFHIPTSYLLMLSLLGMSASSFAFIFCHTFSSFVLFMCLFAICYSINIILRVVLVASILGEQNLDKGYSPLCFLIGLTYIIDTKITGFLFDATQSFDAIFYFISGSLFISGITSIGIIYMQQKRKFYE